MLRQSQFIGLIFFCLIATYACFNLLNNINQIGCFHQEWNTYATHNHDNERTKTQNLSHTEFHQRIMSQTGSKLDISLLQNNMDAKSPDDRELPNGHHKSVSLRVILLVNKTVVDTVTTHNNTIPYPIEYFNKSTMMGPFELQPESITCSTEHTFLIYVISSANELENRTLMRQTWLDLEHVSKFKYDGFHVEKMFVVGGLTYEEPQVADAVRNESLIYRDILSLDYLQDNYVNLSRKVISSMFWIQDHCNLSRVDYVMKADVDILVNIYYILSLAWDQMINGTVHDYICWYLPEKEVDRTGKYSEPWETYGQRDWPRYCHGPAYTSHIDTYRMMLNNIPKIPIMKNEDAMMTGLCVQNKTNLNVYTIPMKRIIKYRHHGLFSIGRRDYMRIPHMMIMAHELPPDEWGPEFAYMRQKRLMGYVHPYKTVRRVRIIYIQDKNETNI